VVDDSEAVCKSLQRDLGELGHHVEYASTFERAAARIRDPYVRFDIAIVDSIVGSIEGLELLGQAAGIHPGVHPVLMSGGVPREQLKRAQMVGTADALLPRPWTRRGLVAAMPM